MKKGFRHIRSVILLRFARFGAWLIVLIFWLPGCAARLSTPPPPPSVPTPARGGILATVAPTVTALPPSATDEPADIVDTSQAPASPVPAPSAAPDVTAFRVAFVAADDVLNVREGPGVARAIVGELAPTAENITLTGEGQVVAGSTWLPVSNSLVQGWVNSRYLTPHLDAAAFCADEAVTLLLSALKAAISARDGETLAQLVHSERGLRIRINWWNPEVRLGSEQISDAFVSDRQYDWGVEDGSGATLAGSLHDKILPLLQADLSGASDIACNEILAGNTAGYVRLPDGYQSVNFYSLHRPPEPGSAGFDWGTWVVGVESWQDAPFVSYLVHYEWEI